MSSPHPSMANFLPTSMIFEREIHKSHNITIYSIFRILFNNK